MTYLWEALASVGLVALNGFFVAAEFALVAARRSRIEQLAADGNMLAKVALGSLRRLSLMLTGAQLGVTVSSLLLGFVAEPLVHHGIESVLEHAMPAWLAGSVAFVLALLVVTFFHMVFGEMVPKNVTIAQPVRTALWVALPFSGFVLVLSYPLRFLQWLANACVRVLGVEPKEELLSTYTPDEIAAMLVESRDLGMIADVEHELLSGALDFRDRYASEIMIPRTSLVAVPAAATPSEVEDVVRREGHSRIPVFEGDLDHILGFVHAKDLLRVSDAERDAPLPRQLVRDMWVVPETRRLLPLLLDMRRERQHFGLVVDEHGGTAGVVALEDIIEELVGEIRDEYDPRSLKLRRQGPGRWVCAGSTRPGELETTGLDLPEGEYETLGGFILDRLGQIPEPGAEVRYEGWTLRVATMEGRRVAEVELVAPRDG